MPRSGHAAPRSGIRARRLLPPLVPVVLAIVAVGLLVVGPAPAQDPTKHPHYFGPYPNWANSPLTLPDATVVVTGNGTGATAVATVGANGSVTGITVTDGGSGYSTAKVDIQGSGTGATADATIVKKGAVVGIAVTSAGSGYTAPVVAITGGGAGSGATATAFGRVDAVTLTDAGSGYTFPTVSFDQPDDPNGVPATGHVTCAEVNCAPAADGQAVTITGVVVDEPGSGYSTAPGVAILNGTQFDPIALVGADPREAVAKATLAIDSVLVDTPGSGYTKAPDVAITDPTGTGATATAAIDNGVISAITVKKPGSGYVTPGGIKKFQDTLPGLGPAAANNLGQYIPVAVPDTTTFPGADYYEIGLVQYRERMSSSLPAAGTLMRGYVQLATDKVAGNVALGNASLDPAVAPTPIAGFKGVDKPHFLGPTIVAQKGRPVRITFYNLLPTGAAGDLFLPVDSTLMGSGEGNMMSGYDPTPTTGGTVDDEVRNPMCTTVYPKPDACFKDNRATLHLHGGNTPWISDGTPHQWITPAGEGTNWPEGVSVESVPDMIGASKPANVKDCSAADDGCQTFYYTNQQSARLMFYHDHAWGITRLNVYAGEAAGYVLRDATERKLFGPGGTFAGLGDGVPLVIQDRTFVPGDAQLAQQDPTWDTARWGGSGNFWYHHVYMPAQNPGDPTGLSSFGRWMYGPWFWPPAQDVKYGPIANPYYDPNCDPNTAEFCEPELIPGTPNISVGMEQFNDTPIVNGTAYPTTTLDPKPYRLRILNAANDRFWNLQWYVADSTGTEVALKAAEVAAAQTDPVVFPTPDTSLSPPGPDWIQIGTEGGFLPAPVVVPNQPTTWITDPTRFDVGNVDQHSLLLAPAERADTIVDFSKFAGKTLILYNDAPAAFPARIACYDYYTGGPDLRPACAPTTLPGYGPNTRTIMQVKIGTGQKTAFNLNALRTAFSHKANGTGVFEEGQHPIIVGQAGYNSAYGKSFAASGYCSSPGSTIKCDGFVRISQQGDDPFTFDTLRDAKMSIPLEPKAIHDEMNSTTFDEFGRMQAFLGITTVPATPGLTNANLHPYVFPQTELIDTTNLPKGDVKVTPIASATDGTQIWKVTHNGVDTHPIHFHAMDVQVLNRVTWDNIIIPPDATELGWKDTVRISPLEDTIVAMRPVIPTLPFDLPNSVKLLSPMLPEYAGNRDAPPLLGEAGVIASATWSDLLLLGIPPSNGDAEPVDIVNHYVNYGAEYVYHCHILSHEEMDMMRPVSFVLAPKAPDTVAVDPVTNTVSWTDRSTNETSFLVQRSTDGGTTWADVGTVSRLFLDPLNAVLLDPVPLPNTAGDTVTLTDAAVVAGARYRVVAQNTVGDTWDYADPNVNEIVSGGFPTVTATGTSNPVTVP
jgi:FtsP/CotA-like multicopper oxidase with cupredoxin domain